MKDHLGKTTTYSKMKTVPRHIAIIMDGNRRWAEGKGLPTLKGHEAGMEAVKKTVEACNKLGVEYLTLYAFSTENWKRPRKEVAGLMRLLEIFLGKYVDRLDSEGIRLRTIGRMSDIPERQRKFLRKSIERTKDNKSGTLTLAISYGGRAEIADAAREIARKAASGEISPSKVGEDLLRAHLYDPELPDPELLIRTSGEFRISNFLIWQISYSEIYFTDVLWPDFGEKELAKAIESYQSRERRFGGR